MVIRLSLVSARRWARAAVILLLGMGPSAAVAAPLVAIKDFARKAEFESAKISPDGDYLAVSMPLEGQTVLGILDLKNRKVSGTLRFGRGEHVSDYWWVGPRRVVTSIATRGGQLDQPRLTGELYAMNADGTQKKYLFGYRAGDQTGTHLATVTRERAWAFMIDPLRHEPEWAMIQITPWDGGMCRGETCDAAELAEFAAPLLERVNVFTGQRQRVAVMPGFGPSDVAADRSGRVRFAYSADRSGALHLYTKIDATADAPSGWKELKLPNGAPESLSLHRVTGDGSSVFLTSSEKGGRACLREFRFDTATFNERACKDSGDVGWPIFGFDDDAPIGMRRERGMPEAEFFDLKHPDVRLLRSLEKSFPGQRIVVTSRTLDGMRLVVRVSSDRNPGDYYLVDRQTKKVDYLISARSWIDPSAMAPSTPISYQTRDGTTVDGYLTARGGLETRKAPLVVMPHGGPHGVRDYWEWDPDAQALASRNYAVLQVNFRGSGGYGDAYEAAGYRKWGTLMQDDLTDAVRWAIDKGIADPARICIMGYSYGGYAALMSAVREPDLYRCAISFAGIYDLEFQASDSAASESRLGRAALVRYLGDAGLMRAQSPITQINRLKAPVLIAHGTADEVVPFGQAKLLRKALEEHGKPYVWMEFSGEEHGFHDDAHREAFLSGALEFLDKHIGAAPAAAK